MSVKTETQENLPRAYNPADAIARFPAILEDVTKGAAFMLVNAGSSFVRFVRLDLPLSETASRNPMKRTGFMKGSIPDDFDTMCSGEIHALFHGK